jgi:hypothetical protein
VAGEGDVARVSAWTMGYLSEQQVRLYLPLLWPVAMALAARSQPILRGSAPRRCPRLLGQSATSNGFTWACVPRDKGERVTRGAVYAGYRRWCQEKGRSGRGAAKIAVDFKAIAGRYGIGTGKDGTKISCLDVR